MFDNIFNDEAIKELAGILAEQEANRTAKEILKKMGTRSAGLIENLQEGIDKVFGCNNPQEKASVGAPA